MSHKGENVSLVNSKLSKLFSQIDKPRQFDAISSPKRLSIWQNNTSKGSTKKSAIWKMDFFLPHEYLEKETILKMEKEVEDLWRNRKENINQQGILRNCTGGWCHTSKVTCKVSKASTTNVHDVE